MNKTSKILLAFSIAGALSAPVLAHHSAAAYDTQKEVKVTGTVKEYRFKNPHVYMMVQVKSPDGSVASMEIEAGAASVLNPLGFTKDSVAVGDVVTIAGNPSRSNPNAILGKDLFKRDGTYYPLNIASRSVYTRKEETASSIAGTWFSPRTEFNAFLGGARNWSVTEKGRTAMAVNADPKATTQKDCIPIGAPGVMFYPVANTITVQKDRVVMKVDWMETQRTVYLDGRKHPPATETSLHGHSVGRWEGDTLVVETTNFKEHPMGLSMQLPGSSKKRLTEKFRLSPDKKSLIYSGTIEDPEYLTRPVEWSGQWQYRPNMPHSNQKCDLDVARQFLK